MNNKKELKEKYLSHNGVICPFCGSDDLNAYEHNFDGTGASVSILCMNCNESWTDIFTLTDVAFED
jgi:hypothetical protein